MLEAPLPPAESGKDMLSKHTCINILNSKLNQCDKCEMLLFFNEKIKGREI